MPVAEPGAWPVPRIDVDVPGRRDTTILVLRQPRVRLAISHQHGVVAIDRPRAVEDPVLPGRLAFALLRSRTIMRRVCTYRLTILVSVQRS